MPDISPLRDKQTQKKEKYQKKNINNAKKNKLAKGKNQSYEHIFFSGIARISLTPRHFDFLRVRRNKVPMTVRIVEMIIMILIIASNLGDYDEEKITTKHTNYVIFE